MHIEKYKAPSTNSAGQTGWLNIGESKETHAYDPAQNSTPDGSKNTT